MKIVLSEDKSLVFFMHENGAEYKFLHDFPALIKGYPYYYSVAKSNVLYNILNRIKIYRKKDIHIQKEVNELANAPRVLKPIPPEFKYHTQPYPAQEVGLRYLYTLGSAGLLMEPGMGKSKVVLDYIMLMGFKKVLIVCPKPLIFVWEEEIEVHRPELDFYAVKTTDWESEKEGIRNARVTIVNYTKAITFKDQLKLEGFTFIHLDEFLIKDPKSLRTIGLTELSTSIPYRCGGSGTLVNNTIVDVFAPVRYIEPSLTGSLASAFLRHFSVRKLDKDTNRERIVAFKGTAEAKSILESCCIVMTKEEWLKDLPKKTFKDIYVNPSEQQRRMIGELAENYVTEFEGEYIEVDNPLVMLTKLYQLSNGFLYQSFEKQDVSDLLATPKEGAVKKKGRKTLFLDEQPKIEALSKLLDRIEEERAIVWFNLSGEFELISKLLDERGIRYLHIRGGEKDTGGKVKTFNRDNTYKILLCQAKSVNYGITVLGNKREDSETDEDIDGGEILPAFNNSVYTQIFYSMSFSLETYLQQQDRIHRFGQKHECKYYRLFLNTPVEHRIRKAIDDKTVLKTQMLVDIAHSLKNEV